MSSVEIPVWRKAALSAAEAAAMLDLSESTIRRHVDDGLISRVPNTGARLIIAREEVDRFAREGVQQTPTVRMQSPNNRPGRAAA